MKNYALLESFDPRPTQYRGTAKHHLPALLEKVRCKDLCVSLLYDERCQNSSKVECPVDTALPSTESLKRTVESFKSSLSLTEEKIRKIGHDTRQQNSSMRYEVWRYCLMASIFGSVLHWRSDTPPDNLVLRIL